MNKKTREAVFSYAFLAPWLIFFVVFMLIPFVYGIVYSVFDYDYASMEFIGLDNFKYILTNQFFLRSIVNTLILAVIGITSTISTTLFLSQLIVRQKRKLQVVSKMGFYIPAVSSSIAITTVWKWVFSPTYGISATILNKLGLPAFDYFSNTATSMGMIALMLLTFSIAQPIVLYTAAMDAIPSTYFEAAEIDGASQFQKFFSITLPLVKPTTLYLLITMTIGGMQVFEVPMFLTGGGPNYATTTILLYLYNIAFKSGQVGRAAAMGVILFVIIGVLAIVQFRTMKSDVTY
jgi:multiple sugar transport system permease protein